MKLMRLHKIQRDPMALSETNPVLDRGMLLILDGSLDRFAITDGVTSFTNLAPLTGTSDGPTDF